MSPPAPIVYEGSIHVKKNNPVYGIKILKTLLTNPLNGIIVKSRNPENGTIAVYYPYTAEISDCRLTIGMRVEEGGEKVGIVSESCW